MTYPIPNDAPDASHPEAAPESPAKAPGAQDPAPFKDTPYDNGEGEDEEEDEDETCGFCRFMKAGGCKQAFNAWSSCVDKERESGNDFTEECRDVTLKLRECMLAHKDYYAPLLEEEEEAARQAAADAASQEPTEVVVVDLQAAAAAGEPTGSAPDVDAKS